MSDMQVHAEEYCGSDGNPDDDSEAISTVQVWAEEYSWSTALSARESPAVSDNLRALTAECRHCAV